MKKKIVFFIWLIICQLKQEKLKIIDHYRGGVGMVVKPYCKPGVEISLVLDTFQYYFFHSFSWRRVGQDGDTIVVTWDLVSSCIELQSTFGPDEHNYKSLSLRMEIRLHTFVIQHGPLCFKRGKGISLCVALWLSFSIYLRYHASKLSNGGFYDMFDGPRWYCCNDVDLHCPFSSF